IRDFHVTGVQTCALPICPANPDGTYFQADGEGVITATGYSAVPGAQFSWVKSGSGTYNDGFKARRNEAWVQFNRNGGEKLQAREIGRASCRGRAQNRVVG